MFAKFWREKLSSNFGGENFRITDFRSFIWKKQYFMNGFFVYFSIFSLVNLGKYEEFDLSKAQEILKYPITYALVNDYYTVSRSLNAGLPVSDLDKNCLLAKQFDELARMMISDFKNPADRSSSLMGKFKKMFPAKKKTVAKEKAMPSAPISEKESHAA